MEKIKLSFFSQETIESSKSLVSSETRDFFEEYEFRPDSEMLLGGLFINKTENLYCLENNINFRQFSISLSSLLISFLFLNVPAQAKSTNQSNTVSISRVLTRENSQDKGLDKKPDGNQHNKRNSQKKFIEKKNQKQEFDPFSSEIKEEILKQKNFILELENFKKVKVSNSKNFCFKNNKPGIFLKPNPVVFLANDKGVEKYSAVDKLNYTKKLFCIIKFVRDHKLLIFSFFIGSLVIVIYFLFKSNKLSLFDNKLLPKNIFKEQNLKVQDVKNNSPIVSKIEVTQIENSEEVHSTVEEISPSDKQISDSIIEPIPEKIDSDLFPTQENSINQLKKEELRVCIEKGKILKARDTGLDSEIQSLMRIKDQFVEFGEESVSNEEEWMVIAKAIKAEMDRLLQARIDWEKEYNLFQDTCQ